MNKIWKPVPGFEKTHIISTMGRVASLPRDYVSHTPTGLKCMKHVDGKILKQRLGNTGYFRVALSVMGTIKEMSIHRLIAMAFIPNPNGFPQINHIDGCKVHNIADNLEWCSASKNQLHAIALGLTKISFGSDRAFAKLTDDDVREIRNQISDGITQWKIAKAFGVCPSKITFIKQGKAWKHVI